MYLSPRQCKITYSPGRFRNDYTNARSRVQNKPPNPSQTTGQETISGEAFDFQELKERPINKCEEIVKKGEPPPCEQTVKVTVWHATGQGERAADTALACWDSAESGRWAGQWMKGYRWQRFIKMLLYCQKLARQRGIKFSDVQYSNLRRTYLTLWFVWSLPIL